jgi:hypothetical protein
MDQVTAFLHNPDMRAISLQLLALYCISVALFFGVDMGNHHAAVSLKDGIKGDKVPPQLFVFAIAAAANALAVLTLVFVSKKLDTIPRLAMIGLPLLLLVEKHVRHARQDKENRRAELLIGAGMTIGILGAAFVLMRGCPIK